MNKELYSITFRIARSIKVAFSVAENEEEAIANLKDKLTRNKEIKLFEGVESICRFGDNTIIL